MSEEVPTPGSPINKTREVSQSATISACCWKRDVLPTFEEVIVLRNQRHGYYVDERVMEQMRVESGRGSEKEGLMNDATKSSVS